MAKIQSALEFKPDQRLIDERGATVYRRLKAAGAFDMSDTGKVTFRDTPIERANSQGDITSSQYNAATKFYNHWYRAGLAGRLGSADLNRVFGGDDTFSGMPRTEAEAFHRQMFRGAIEVVGDRGSWALVNVICFEQKFEDIGKEMKWANRPQAKAAGLQVTRDALDILCREWGT